ncbi:MAG: DUF4920 domain-containing protein [Chitinophagales bacterium]|nr:DUF4920 domain-containing protein [Chitinophagales bacterium]
MKKVLAVCMLVVVAVLGVQAQSGKKTKGAKETSYGAPITKDGAVDVKLMPEKMKGQPAAQVKITGKVISVCQVKGCWMTADLGNGKTMRIRFKDYAFFMPKDCSGQTFYAEGKISWDTTSIAQLRHYAEDAGKSKEEIEKITEPAVELVFLADGVILEAKKPE